MRFFLLLALLPLVFAVHKPGNDDEYFDILGTGKKEWRLTFRGTAHIRTSVYEAYRTGSNIPPNVNENCKKTDWKAPCNSHYRNNDAMDHWHGVHEVLFGIVHDGILVETLRFDGVKSDNMNWFSMDRLHKSCWADLKGATHNYFSIAGDGVNHRRFFINNKYDKCPGDKGWFVAVDQANPPCSWEAGGYYPYFKYVAGPKLGNYNTKAFKNADAIVVFVKYLPGEYKEYFDILGSGKEEWRLAFRGTAGTGTSVYKAYLDGTGIPPYVEDGCKGTDYYKSCGSHWRNKDALENWGDIEYVLFGVIANGEMVKNVIFKGEATSYTNWMSLKGVYKSCWADLTTAKMHNYFSIQGDNGLNRRFFMNSDYQGCPNDKGWFIAADFPTKPCPWETAPKYPNLLFSGSPTLENYTNGEVRKADAFVIFLKYKQC